MPTAKMAQADVLLRFLRNSPTQTLLWSNNVAHLAHAVGPIFCELVWRTRKMIHFFLLVSRQGKCRLSKWYTPYPDKEKKKMIRYNHVCPSQGSQTWFCSGDRGFELLSLVPFFSQPPPQTILIVFLVALLQAQHEQLNHFEIRGQHRCFAGKFRRCAWRDHRSCAISLNGGSTRSYTSDMPVCFSSLAVRIYMLVTMSNQALNSWGKAWMHAPHSVH